MQTAQIVMSPCVQVPSRGEITALLTGAAMKTEVSFLNGSTMWLVNPPRPVPTVLAPALQGLACLAHKVACRVLSTTKGRTEVTGRQLMQEFDSGMTVANAVEAAAAQAGIRDPTSYTLFEGHQARVSP